MSHKRPFSVLVALHTEDRQTLLLHRQAPARFWQSVTGSLEAGETPAEAAVREIQEETGLVVPSTALRDWQIANRYAIPEAWAARYRPGDRHNTEHVFSLSLPSPVEVQIDPTEHSAACWLPLNEAIDHAWSWTNKDLLALILAEYGA